MNDKQILQDLGLGEASEEMQTQALESVNTVVELRTLGLLEDLMTKEQADEFAKRSESESKDEVMKWISKEVVNAEELYESVLKDYLKEKKSQS